MFEHFWEYAIWHRDQCRDLGLDYDELFYREEPGSEARRGFIHGDVTFSGDINAYLKVKEVIAIGGEEDSREEYAYYLIVNGVELWGRERDPCHVDEEVHHHPRDHRGRIPSEPISFSDAVEEAWANLNHIAEFGLDDEYDPLGPP